MAGAIRRHNHRAGRGGVGEGGDLVLVRQGPDFKRCEIGALNFDRRRRLSDAVGGADVDVPADKTGRRIADDRLRRRQGGLIDRLRQLARRPYGVLRQAGVKSAGRVDGIVNRGDAGGVGVVKRGKRCLPARAKRLRESRDVAGILRRTREIRRRRNGIIQRRRIGLHDRLHIGAVQGRRIGCRISLHLRGERGVKSCRIGEYLRVGGRRDAIIGSGGRRIDRQSGGAELRQGAVGHRAVGGQRVVDARLCRPQRRGDRPRIGVMGEAAGVQNIVPADHAPVGLQGRIGRLIGDLRIIGGVSRNRAERRLPIGAGWIRACGESLFEGRDITRILRAGVSLDLLGGRHRRRARVEPCRISLNLGVRRGRNLIGRGRRRGIGLQSRGAEREGAARSHRSVGEETFIDAGVGCGGARKERRLGRGLLRGGVALHLLREAVVKAGRIGLDLRIRRGRDLVRRRGGCGISRQPGRAKAEAGRCDHSIGQKIVERGELRRPERGACISLDAGIAEREGPVDDRAGSQQRIIGGEQRGGGRRCVILQSGGRQRHDAACDRRFGEQGLVGGVIGVDRVLERNERVDAGPAIGLGQVKAALDGAELVGAQRLARRQAVGVEDEAVRHIDGDVARRRIDEADAEIAGDAGQRNIAGRQSVDDAVEHLPGGACRRVGAERERRRAGAEAGSDAACQARQRDIAAGDVGGRGRIAVCRGRASAHGRDCCFKDAPSGAGDLGGGRRRQAGDGDRIGRRRRRRQIAERRDGHVAIGGRARAAIGRRVGHGSEIVGDICVRIARRRGAGGDICDRCGGIEGEVDAARRAGAGLHDAGRRSRRVRRHRRGERLRGAADRA